MSLTTWAALAVGLPLATFFVMLLGLRKLPAVMVGLSLLSAFVTCVATWIIALGLPAEGVSAMTPWAVTDDFTFYFGFRLSGLSTAMGCVVGSIHLLVQLYSLGYMKDDPDKGRYFGVLSGFVAVMLAFVLAADLAMAYIGWELVGLASYLLIGFWSHKPAAAQAAKKAFVMTRFGDIGLFLGLVTLLLELGDLRYETILAAVDAGTLSPKMTTLSGLLILCGVAGKSAQFPLHTWLPDAMEGPTPVSSLLHSATMVAAGVYLVAVLHPLMMASETTSNVLLAIALLTALLSASVAMVERDMKRVLAWSSISQLSFMLMGLAAGSLMAGFFHLVTHAAFKCLLFLTAGLFIHLAHSGDLYDMGKKVGRSHKIATLGLVVGALSLAGMPPFAGFMSKELILTALHERSMLLWAGALLASAMTAYYSGRLIFLVLTGPREPDEHHEEDGGMKIMGGVVAALALLALAVAGLGGSLATHLGLDPQLATIHMSPYLGAAVGAFVLGMGLAFFDFGRAGAKRVGFLGEGALARFFVQGWFVDAFWRQVSDKGIAGLTAFALLIDRRAIDRGIDGFGEQTKRTGFFAASLQSGRLQLYISTSLGVLALLILLLESQG